MSLRLNIAPAMPDPEVADWTIPMDARMEQVDAVADACWPSALRVFAPATDDWRLRRLMDRLGERELKYPEHYNVFVIRGREDEKFDSNKCVDLQDAEKEEAKKEVGADPEQFAFSETPQD